MAIRLIAMVTQVIWDEVHEVTASLEIGHASFDPTQPRFRLKWRWAFPRLHTDVQETDHHPIISRFHLDRIDDHGRDHQYSLLCAHGGDWSDPGVCAPDLLRLKSASVGSCRHEHRR